MKTWCSKEDFPFVLSLLAIMFLLELALLGIYLHSSGEYASAAIWGVLLMLIGLAILIPRFLIPADYFITSASLIIHNGLVRWEIPLAHIRRVDLSPGLVAAPALSIQRLRIEYVQGNRVKCKYISLLSRDRFLKALTYVDRGLVRVKEGIVRTSGKIVLFPFPQGSLRGRTSLSSQAPR